ncbi:hypothetical protein MLD38_014770 [Melastoma candidum]|uniref:Uncharacterized protein n=1 Tax=Melastoma candidum TaxID=119954 RepID=A0ACB9RDY7_9MYRT|nr:hypothetical protein MLD38_014770 [Melastoma candidum]
MKNNSVHDEATVTRQMLLDQGYLDNYFMQLEQIEASGNPNFVRYIFNLYFEDTEKYIHTVERCLEMSLPNSDDVDGALYRLKGSSASIGANKVKIEVNRLRAMCKEKDAETERCKELLQNLKRERAILKEKMDNYFQLLKSAEPEPSADSVVTRE